MRRRLKIAAEEVLDGRNLVPHFLLFLFMLFIVFKKALLLQ